MQEIMRKKFEQHMVGEVPVGHVLERDGEGYRRMNVQAAWVTWRTSWGAAIEAVKTGAGGRYSDLESDGGMDPRDRPNSPEGQESSCLCDGAAYHVEPQQHPFIINAQCPVHATKPERPEPVGSTVDANVRPVGSKRLDFSAPQRLPDGETAVGSDPRNAAVIGDYGRNMRRLWWLLSQEAYVSWDREGMRCRVFRSAPRGADDEAKECLTDWHDDPRKAIDAAILAAAPRRRKNESLG